MTETALVFSPPAGTAPTVPVGPALEAGAKIITGPWHAVTNEPLAALATPDAVSEDGPRWLPTQHYEAILAGLAADNAARADRNWEPDTPEYAAGRTEITEALLDEQLAIITRTED